MSETVRQSIYQAIASIRLIDPHTHINPHAPASTTLADILGYHYYTELAHSSGMAKSIIQQEGIGPRELVGRLVGGLQHIDNTANYAWLVQLCQKFFDFDDDRIDHSNWESLYDAAEDRMASAEWPHMVLDASNVESVFLTNDFDDPLEGFDAGTYIPCLRTDDLVFHLAKRETRERLAACTGIELDGSTTALRDSMRLLFEHFVKHGARACAISIPPAFEPVRVSDGRAATAMEHVLRQNLQADPSHLLALSRRVFWTLAELCDEYSLPFDLMIGVNRGVYPDGVYQGQDLYDSRVSLTQYRELFNAFPDVKFPISVLASVTNQELVSHAWIFPNVYTNGHWWYSNTPSFISRDLNARLEAVPRNKQVAYYSDAYKLEFVWPKFDMYRQILARVLTDHFVVGSGWSEEQAIDLARQVLRGNVEEIFRRPGETFDASKEETGVEEPFSDAASQTHFDTVVIEPDVKAASSALAAGAIGMIEVAEQQVDGHDDELQVPEASEDTWSGDEAPAVAEPTADVTDTDELSVGDPLQSTWIPGEASEVAEPQVDGLDDGGLDVGEIDDGELDDGEPPLDEASEETWVPDEASEVDESVDGAEPLDGAIEDGLRVGEASEETWVPDDEADEQLAIDPLPSDDEVAEVDVADVELNDWGAETLAIDAEGIEASIDEEPLDVGDLLADDEDADSQIQMLQGDASFAPDEESLRLTPDPTTGEWTMPVEESSDDEFILDEQDEDES